MPALSLDAASLGSVRSRDRVRRTNVDEEDPLSWPKSSPIGTKHLPKLTDLGALSSIAADEMTVMVEADRAEECGEAIRTALA